MIYGFHVDVLLGATYAVFLVIVAAILERVALQSHRLSRQMEVAGFRYHTVHDRWECPTGQHLERHQTDHRLRIVTYRAPAHVCNACHCRGIVQTPKTAAASSTGSIPGCNPKFGDFIAAFRCFYSCWPD